MRSIAGVVVLAACGGTSGRGAKTTTVDPSKLHVIVSVRDLVHGSHKRPLRSGATTGLANVPFAMEVERDGEVELIVQLARLERIGDGTRCEIKILVLALPSHDMIGIADGGAQASAHDDRATAECIEGIGASLIVHKVRPLLQRQFHARRN